MSQVQTPSTDGLFISVKGSKPWPVSSFAEASEIFCRARDAYGEGARKTPSPLIRNARGEVIAHISYNGRVWAGQSWVTGAVPLFCPYSRVEG